MSQAHILVVDDEPDIRNLVSEILEDEGYTVESAQDGEQARSLFAARQPDLVLLDIWMPDIDGISLLREWSADGSPACPVIVMSGHGTLETAVEATRLGARDFVQKPLSLAKLLATVRQALKTPVPKTAPRPPVATFGSEPLGESPQMQLLRQRAKQAAGHGSPVLIVGETGSGKGQLAAYIHQLSGRSGELILADSSQMDDAKVHAYLLGEADGSSGGPGVLERARGGSLFVPELQSLSATAQELLNAVLTAGAYTRPGGAEAQPLDLRLIVGANSNVEQLVQEGRLLESLYYQVNVLLLEVPPLRSRPEDVPELVRYYAEWFPNQEDLPYRSFSVAALNRLRNHSWPGNVRELRNLVQRLLIMGGEGEVSAREVEAALQHNAAESPTTPDVRPSSFDLPLREAREQFEREYLQYQLEKAGGSVGKLSESVGMERTHLYRKLRALGIDPKAAARKGGKQ